MRQHERPKHIAQSYEIISQKTTVSRTYRMVKWSLPDMSTYRRKRVIETLLNESGAIGSMEWWMKGSIVSKPREQFCIVLVLEREPV